MRALRVLLVLVELHEGVVPAAGEAVGLLRLLKVGGALAAEAVEAAQHEHVLAERVAVEADKGRLLRSAGVLRAEQRGGDHLGARGQLGQDG